MVGLPLVVVASLFSAWAIDTAIHRDRVVRNVKVAGETVGGLSDIALRARVEAIANRITTTRISIESELGSGAWTAGDLGVSIDVAATYDAAMSTRRQGTLSRPLNWLSALTSTTSAEIKIDVDISKLEAVLHSYPGFRSEPVEPSVQVVQGRLEAVPSVVGKLIDLEETSQVLAEAIKGGGSPTIQVGTVELLPRFSDEEVVDLVRTANKVVETHPELRLNDYQTLLPSHVVASWFALDTTGQEPTLTINQPLVLPSLEELLIPGNTGAGQAQFDVQGDVVSIISSDGGTACCDTSAVNIVLSALDDGPTNQIYVLPNRPAAPREAVNRLQALGVVERVSSFTTYYSCCLGRVTNIQKFAEIVNGKWIKPGGRLSLNETVGRRTEENGFVNGGFISKGHLVEAIGGGISQFATTIFNAAVRAGLEFEHYQAHSIYFSRYPFGLEATISYPNPDLIITNPTPFGVLIWNSWTDESITVDIYSTVNVEVTLDEPEVILDESTGEAIDLCTHVKTRRNRLWKTGTEEADHFFATYRPEEGLNCDGTPSDPDQTTTTIAVDETTEEVSDPVGGDDSPTTSSPTTTTSLDNGG
jgi:vancomycin resistance protein YoaR